MAFDARREHSARVAGEVRIRTQHPFGIMQRKHDDRKLTEEIKIQLLTLFNQHKKDFANFDPKYVDYVFNTREDLHMIPDYDTVVLEIGYKFNTPIALENEEFHAQRDAFMVILERPHAKESYVNGGYWYPLAIVRQSHPKSHHDEIFAMILKAIEIVIITENHLMYLLDKHKITAHGQDIVKDYRKKGLLHPYNLDKKQMFTFRNVLRHDKHIFGHKGFEGSIFGAEEQEQQLRPTG